MSSIANLLFPGYAADFLFFGSEASQSTVNING